MDKYSKIILTVIALSLIAIAVNLTIQNINITGENKRPTFGDRLKLRDIKDPAILKAERAKIYAETPLVYVLGGDVSVSGSVSVD